MYVCTYIRMQTPTPFGKCDAQELRELADKLDQDVRDKNNQVQQKEGQLLSLSQQVRCSCMCVCVCVCVCVYNRSNSRSVALLSSDMRVRACKSPCRVGARRCLAVAYIYLVA